MTIVHFVKLAKHRQHYVKLTQTLEGGGALRYVYLHGRERRRDVVCRLPNGFDTELPLSGGGEGLLLKSFDFFCILFVTAHCSQTAYCLPLVIVQ